MRKPSLTGDRLWLNGRLAHTYEWGGGTVAVHDSAKNMLLVIELFGDQQLFPGDKLVLCAEIVLADLSEIPAERLIECLDSVLWDACGLDITGSRPTETGGSQAFDWQEDAGRIRASLLMAYGIDWDEVCTKLTFAEVCDLLGMLMESDNNTPFREAVYYRTAEPPKREKGNAEYVDAWRKRRDYYRLDTERTRLEERQRSDASADAAFESLWKAATRG